MLKNCFFGVGMAEFDVLKFNITTLNDEILCAFNIFNKVWRIENLRHLISVAEYAINITKNTINIPKLIHNRNRVINNQDQSRY